MPKNNRRQDNEAFAIGRTIKGSERKLNLLAQLIRGLPVQKALVELEFNRRRVSDEVYKVLQSAISNAENNHGLDVDRLYVQTATVGRTMTLKRFHARGRGRSSGIEKPVSNITIVVREREAAAEEPKKKPAVKKKAAAKPAATKAGE
jgi:large subunit ribosomal protein L22